MYWAAIAAAPQCAGYLVVVRHHYRLAGDLFKGSPDRLVEGCPSLKQSVIAILAARRRPC